VLLAGFLDPPPGKQTKEQHLDYATNLEYERSKSCAEPILLVVVIYLFIYLFISLIM
jgi:hypothetical protein